MLYAQEAGTLREGRRAEAVYLCQFGAAAERAVLVAEGYDVGGYI